ncbi:MAG: CDP-alcohol phosphatidyltransferase family protein, partial [Pseudomonadales bacterium]
MIDARLRPWIDPPLNSIARQLARFPVSANQVTITGFITGLAAVPLIATQHELLALIAIALSRLFDGLDGALAR